MGKRVSKCLKEKAKCVGLGKTPREQHMARITLLPIGIRTRTWMAIEVESEGGIGVAEA